MRGEEYKEPWSYFHKLSMESGKKTEDFHIEISQEKLKQWPEKGNLADMNPECHILEENKDNEDNEDSDKNEK